MMAVIPPPPQARPLPATPPSSASRPQYPLPPLSPTSSAVSSSQMILLQRQREYEMMLARGRAQVAMGSVTQPSSPLPSSSPPLTKNPSPLPSSPIAKNASPLPSQGAKEPSPTKPPLAVPPATIASSLQTPPPVAAISSLPALHPAILATIASITESNHKQSAAIPPAAGSANHPHVTLDIPQAESASAPRVSIPISPDPRVLVAYHDAVASSSISNNTISPTKQGAAPVNVSPAKSPSDHLRIVIKTNPYLAPPRPAARIPPPLVDASSVASPPSTQEFKRPMPPPAIEASGVDSAKRSKVEGN